GGRPSWPVPEGSCRWWTCGHRMPVPGSRRGETRSARRGNRVPDGPSPTVRVVTADVPPQGAQTRPAPLRERSRTAGPPEAVATLTYVYSDSTAVVGPLATYAEPHTYDLCTEHAERLTPPRGWDIVRLNFDEPTPIPSSSMALCLGDDLVAIADAVREEPVAAAPDPAERAPSAAVS